MNAPVARPTRPTTPRPMPTHRAGEGPDPDPSVVISPGVAVTGPPVGVGVSEGALSVAWGVGRSGGRMGTVLPPPSSAAATWFSQSPSSDAPTISTTDAPMRSRARAFLPLRMPCPLLSDSISRHC